MRKSRRIRVAWVAWVGALLGGTLALSGGPARGDALTPAQAGERAATLAGEPAGPPARLSLLVELAPGTDRGPLRALVRERGAHVRYEYTTVLPDVINVRGFPASAVDALQRLPGVVGVESDEYHPNLIKLHDSVPLVRGLPAQLEAAGLGGADGAGVRVCVLDTGIDSDHSMYSSRIDFAAGVDFVHNDNDPEDDHGHGSHVAGIALGGSGPTVNFGCNGDEPFQGVATAATLIGVKVLNAQGGGNESDVVAGIDHCADPNLPGGPADVLNLSLGLGQFTGACDSHVFAEAANNAAAAGRVVVAAAGNEGYSGALASPACASDVITVAATYDEDFPNCEDSRSSFTWCLDSFLCFSSCTDASPSTDDLICFSNQSPLVDVAAPGCVTFSASPTDSQGTGTTIVGQCGTSMAAPHVAGLAALLLEQDPTLTPAEVRQLIRDGAVDRGPVGFDEGYGYGRIDVINSLQLVQPDVCGDAICGAGEDACGCPEDCGAPLVQESSCTDGIDDDCDGVVDCDDTECTTDDACICDGDLVCELGEDCTNCPSDCPTAAAWSCGDGVCNAGDGEDCVSCPDDCSGRQNGKPSSRYCCGDGDGDGPLPCSDASCSAGGWSCSDAPSSGGACCGDLVCDAGESVSACPLDCDTCGDGVCDPGEDICSCPDCGTPPASELSCSDGLDDDCDGAVDCSDAECAGSGACSCTAAGDPCASDADCCSGRCKGKPGARTCRE